LLIETSATEARRLESGAGAVVPGRLRLLIVVVNYRTPGLTIECLRSLRDEVTAVEGCHVVVVDNGSGDGSAQQIERQIEQQGWDWVTLLALQNNGGFSFGNNRGWETAKHADYVLLLNSDTVVHAGCLTHCYRVMESDATIGALSCLVLNADGTVQNVARRIPTVLNQLACALGLPWRWPNWFGGADTEDPGWDRRGTSRDVGWIGGAFMFLRGDLVRRIGLLDEAFFFYGEDIEFCHRTWRSGYRVRYDPGASITHYGGASSDPTRLPVRLQNAHRWHARYLVQRKCNGRLSAWLLRLSDLTTYGARLVYFACAGRTTGSKYSDVRRSLSIMFGRV
jgi:GT2 family glycosyltransferase